MIETAEQKIYSIEEFHQEFISRGPGHIYLNSGHAREVAKLWNPGVQDSIFQVGVLDYMILPVQGVIERILKEGCTYENSFTEKLVDAISGEIANRAQCNYILRNMFEKSCGDKQKIEGLQETYGIEARSDYLNAKGILSMLCSEDLKNCRIPWDNQTFNNAIDIITWTESNFDFKKDYYHLEIMNFERDEFYDYNEGYKSSIRDRRLQRGKPV